MSPSDLLFAAALLTASVGTPEPIPSEERWPAVRDALHSTAVEWEIMDKRETRYVLAARDDFEEDLNLLRGRYHDLKDAPKIIDCNRLPERRLIGELIKFNREYKKHLEERELWETDRADLIQSLIKQNNHLYRIWDNLRDAQCDFYYVTVRRGALKRYRDAIGEEAYAQGKLPPYVPAQEFYKK